MDTLERLAKCWPIVKWLDDARWSGGPVGSEIPGPVFQSHSDPGRVLTHWLSYITDQQRPYEQVWNQGAPVFAELASQYLSSVSSPEQAFDLLLDYTRTTPDGDVDQYVSRRQRLEGKPVTYRPRFGAHQLSIARTLWTLVQYDKDIMTYLLRFAGFWSQAKLTPDSSVWRIAFLLYILSYGDIRTGMVSFHSQRQDFLEDLRRRDREIRRLTQDKGALEASYRQWLKGAKYHKRLWAAFRDYVKPGSYWERPFMRMVNDSGDSQAAQLFGGDRRDVLEWLEFPGDVWNLRFTDRLFGGAIAHPKDLRSSYTRLRQLGMTNSFYPEQFDISFDFSPRMCERGSQDLCPLRKDSIISEYCLSAAGLSGTYCPVTMILCGYRSACRPEGCPVAESKAEDLCPGCRVSFTQA